MHSNGKPADAPVLEVSGISKVYGSEVALADVSMRVQRGEIHGLLGANGAGKSTLVRIVSGVEQQDAGTVTIGGKRLPAPHDASAARAAGLVHIHQDRALVGDLTVAENVALTVGFSRGRTKLIDRGEMRAVAAGALEQVSLDVDVDANVCDLPIADQTLIAIARALAVDARVILLDEPTANLGAHDSQRLYERLSALAAEGVSSVLITHALAEARQVCQHVTVLRDGRVVAAAHPTDRLADEEELATLVVGRTVASGTRRPARAQVPAGDPVLSFSEVRCDRLGPISFDLHGGEVLGVTGLADSGHLLLGEMLNGVRPIDGGKVMFEGAEYAPRGPHEVTGRGLACLPPDRIGDGLAVQMSTRENLFFDGRGAGSPRAIWPRRERAAAAEALRQGKVHPPDPEAIVSTLSGGNMQKVLMARCLSVSPRLIVLCEPTVGVDVGAREDIYARLDDATGRGAAILLASSDFEEIATLSDRVIVIQYGAVVAQLPSSDATVERLTALSSGANGGLRA